jgi:hypothetical protein
MRRRLGDGQRDRAGACPDVDDDPRPVVEMAGRADDEPCARLARVMTNGLVTSSKLPNVAVASMSQFFIPNNGI